MININKIIAGFRIFYFIQTKCVTRPNMDKKEIARKCQSFWSLIDTIFYETHPPFFLCLAIGASSMSRHSHTTISLRSIHFAQPISKTSAIVLSGYHFFASLFAPTSRYCRVLRGIPGPVQLFPHRATTFASCLFLSCAVRMAARLIVLEKFNFDDADGRPNSKDASVSRPKT